MRLHNLLPRASRSGGRAGDTGENGSDSPAPGLLQTGLYPHLPLHFTYIFAYPVDLTVFCLGM